MRCPRCLNEDLSLFAKGSRGWYCRACIGFHRQLLYEEQQVLPPPAKVETPLSLDFELTEAQKEISRQLKEAVIKQDVLLYAVCGAGKTEMLLEMLQDCFVRRKRVAIAIARRQVVLELAQRLQRYFPLAKIRPVCQGYTKETEADLIVCTTHQLYRFYQAFDVLVLDEPDAFPFKGNPVLAGIAETSCRGHRVYLTATPDQTLERAVAQNKMRQLSLMQRPHGYPLPLPRCFYGPDGLALAFLAGWLYIKNRQHRQALIFVPTIRWARGLARCFSFFFSVSCCTSKTVDPDSIIASFHQRQTRFCFCTTILERGVTFSGIDVAVLRADHGVFDEAALIQIAGRAGRRKEAPTGEVRFYARRKKRTIERCLERIKAANQTLPVLSATTKGNGSVADGAVWKRSALSQVPRAAQTVVSQDRASRTERDGTV